MVAEGTDPSTTTNNEDYQSKSCSSPKQPVVCVFCGTFSGTSPAHLAAGRALSQRLHKYNYKLVYGGGMVGVMGEVAKTLVALSGPQAVQGVIPRALMEYERNYGHTSATANSDRNPRAAIDEATFGYVTVVPDMHTRKQLMVRAVIEGARGSGFISLSGGYGTLEELMEVVTWNQLGIHSRPIVIFNVEGYWDGLLQWVENAVASGFVSENNKSIMVEANSEEEVIERLCQYRNSDGRLKLHWKDK